jgi:hypothetical protein
MRKWFVSERGDLNTETGEISQDRGNHAIRLTRAGLMRQVFREVFAIYSVIWPVHGWGLEVRDRCSCAGDYRRSDLRVLSSWAVDGAGRSGLPSVMRVVKRNMRRRSVVSHLFRTDEWEYPEGYQKLSSASLPRSPFNC